MIGRLLRGVTDRRRKHLPSGAPVVPGARGVPTIEYHPRRDGRPDPGEVVWGWVAYEDDPTQGKDRPVLIIGRLGDMLAGIALTTKDHGPADDRVPVGTGSWDAARRPSFAKIDRILAVDPATVRREGATFGRAEFDAVVALVERRNGLTPSSPGASSRSSRAGRS